MNKEISLVDYQQAFRKIVEKEQKTGFYIHSFFYVVVNAGLITLNLSSLTTYHWFYWPLCGWGFGLSMHFIFGILLLNTFMKKKEIRAEKIARNDYYKTEI